MKKIILDFYEAFEKLDANKMIDCYHSDIVFEDPAFGKLRGERAKNMWRMLCESQKGKEFAVNLIGADYDGKKGTAKWEAYYSFSKTGRRVHNKISAEFLFKDGKIILHKDHFNLYKWSRQALGISGLFLGWSSFFKNKLQKQTNKMLSNFEEKQSY